MVPVPVSQLHQRPNPEYVPTVPVMFQVPPETALAIGYALGVAQLVAVALG